MERVETMSSPSASGSGCLVAAFVGALIFWFWWDPGGWQAARDQHDRDVQQKIKDEQKRLEEEPHVLYTAWMRLHPTSDLNEAEWQALHKHKLLPP